MDIPNDISGSGSVKLAAPKIWTSNYLKFLLDAAIFVGFWMAYNAHATGRTAHEWFSMALGAALLVHLGLSWRWVVNVAMRCTHELYSNLAIVLVLAHAALHWKWIVGVVRRRLDLVSTRYSCRRRVTADRPPM